MKAIDIRTFSEFGVSPFIPVPDVDLRTRVAGAPVSPEHYRQGGLVIAADVLNVFATYGGPRRDISIVDLGCGAGRVAALLCQLFPGCRYTGIDVQADLVSWAQDMLGSRLPTLQFQRVGLENHYAGHKSFNIPAEDESVDLIVATSLFTHLDDEATAGYFREMRRVMAPKAVAYVTYFRFDDAKAQEKARAAAARSGHPLTQSGRCWYWGAEGILDTFFEESDLHAIAHENGLGIQNVRWGYWAREQTLQDEPAAFQDLMIIRRADLTP